MAKDSIIKKEAGQEEEASEKGMAPDKRLEYPDLDACRCKEVSSMTPTGLLRLMIKDLSIWKRRRE